MKPVVAIVLTVLSSAANAQAYGVGVGLLLGPDGRYVNGTFSMRRTPECAEVQRGPQPGGPFELLETDKVSVADAIWVPIETGWFCLSNKTKGLSWKRSN